MLYINLFIVIIYIKIDLRYFVVVCDEENEFGDGPTPEGMEGLEWDMEVNDTNDFNMGRYLSANTPCHPVTITL